MGGLFGKKKKKPALDQSEKALLDCKMVRDKIKGYIKTLERNEQLKKTKAKESLREKKKDRAKMLLKLAKMYGEQIKASDNQLTMIEDQIAQIEFTKNQAEIMKVLQQGNEALKNLQKEVNVEKWEQVKDDLDELKEKDNELTEFFKERGLNPDDVEDSVNKELEELMKLNSQEAEIDLPSANQEKVEVPETKEKEKEEKKMVEA